MLTTPWVHTICCPLLPHSLVGGSLFLHLLKACTSAHTDPKSQQCPLSIGCHGSSVCVCCHRSSGLDVDGCLNWLVNNHELGKVKQSWSPCSTQRAHCCKTLILKSEQDRVPEAPPALCTFDGIDKSRRALTAQLKPHLSSQAATSNIRLANDLTSFSCYKFEYCSCGNFVRVSVVCPAAPICMLY